MRDDETMAPVWKPKEIQPLFDAVIRDEEPALSEEEITQELVHDEHNRGTNSTESMCNVVYGVKRRMSKMSGKLTKFVKVSSTVEAYINYLRRHGARLGYNLHTVEDYKGPQQMFKADQCFKCLGFLHKSTNCL